MSFLGITLLNLRLKHFPVKKTIKRHFAVFFTGCIFVSLVLLTASPPIKHAGKSSVIKNTVPSTIVDVQFKDRTLSSGLMFSHLQGGHHLTGLTETLGSGACAFDYDNDGWVDLFLVNGSGQTKYYGSQQWWHLPRGHVLYRNTGNGTFVDTSIPSGIHRQSWGMGCATGDFDNDGDDDLVITNIGENYLYRNNGDGTFTDVSRSSGLTDAGWSTSVAISDYDGDGLLDLYVTNYLQYKKGAHTFESGSQFSGQTMAEFDPTLYPGAGNHLYKNTGNMVFKDVTNDAGVANSSGRSLSAIWLDIDQNHGPDLLVSNEAGFPNALFISTGNGSFVERGADFNLNNALGSHGIAIGDLNNDGKQSLVLTSSEDQTLQIYSPVMKNNKFTYLDTARQMGVGDEQHISLSGWNVGLHDFNRDGLIDLFSVNGLVTPDTDTDKLPQGQKKLFWLNQGDGHFSLMDNNNSVLSDTQSARGAAFADFDNDGDMDVFVSHNNDMGQYLANQSPPQNWVGFSLHRKNNSNNIQGSKIVIQTDNATQTRIINSNGFLSDSDRRVLFGLGNSDHIKQLTITWPDGASDSWSNIPINQYHTVIEDESSIKTYLAKISETEKSEITNNYNKANSEQRSDLLRWLVQMKGINESLPELKVAINNGDALVRDTAIELLAKDRRDIVLPILIDALSDPSPSIRATSIKAISQYEDEASVRWLIRLFSDPSPEVRRAVADSFAFFYREEEAVVYRKYLALPYLIKLLNDQDMDVRISAIRALANAERFRAVGPLTALLNENNANIKAEAARALGLIREKEAMPALQTLFQDNNQEPVVRAHAIIALQRLGYKKTGVMIDQLLQQSKDQSSGLEVFLEILSDQDDGIVLNQHILQKQLLDWITEKFHKNPDRINSPRSEITAKILGRIKNIKAQALLQEFITSRNTQTREQTVLALSPSIDPGSTGSLIIGLSDESALVRVAALQTIIREQIPLPKNRLEAILSDDVLREKAFKYMMKNPDARYLSPLLHITRLKSENPHRLAAAYEILSRIQGSKPALPGKILHSPDSAIRRAALLYWNSRLPPHRYSLTLPDELKRALNDVDPKAQRTAIEILLVRNESWATTAIENYLLSPDADTNIKRHIFNQLGRTYHDIHMLIKFARLPNYSDQNYALDRLVQLGDVMADDYLRAVVSNHDESVERRFLAAKAIFPRYPKIVITQLWETSL